MGDSKASLSNLGREITVFAGLNAIEEIPLLAALAGI